MESLTLLLNALYWVLEYPGNKFHPNAQAYDWKTGFKDSTSGRKGCRLMAGVQGLQG